MQVFLLLLKSLLLLMSLMYSFSVIADVYNGAVFHAVAGSTVPVGFP
jgi:hypothetical protein